MFPIKFLSSALLTIFLCSFLTSCISLSTLETPSKSSVNLKENIPDQNDLIIAVKNSNYNRVKELLDLGISPDINNKTINLIDEATPKIAALLYEYNAPLPDLFESTEYKSLITESIEAGHHKWVNLIKVVKPNTVITPNGWTLLHHAVFQGYNDAVYELLNSGYIVDAADNDDYTPLSLACLKGDLNLIMVLLDYGANPFSVGENTHLGITNGKSAFDVCESLLNIEAIDLFKNTSHYIPISYLINVNTYLKYLGYIDKTHETLNTKSTDALIKFQIDSGLPAHGIPSFSTYSALVEKNILHLKKEAIDQIKECNADKISKIIDMGLDIDFLDDNGWSMLMTSSYMGNISCVKYLLENNADPNITDSQGKSALLLTLVSDKDDDTKANILKLLISSGANSNQKIDYNYTIKDIAKPMSKKIRTILGVQNDDLLIKSTIFILNKYDGWNPGTYYAEKYPIDHIVNKLWGEDKQLRFINYENDLWYVSYHEGLKHPQKIAPSPSVEWPIEKIEDLWDEGYRIKSVTTWVSQWILLFEKRDAGQKYQVLNNLNNFKNKIQSLTKDGHFIETAKFGYDRLVLVTANDLKYTSQKFTLSSNFPIDFIKSSINQGYSISCLTYGMDHWLVIMSINDDIKSQVWTINDNLNNDSINKYINEKYRIYLVTSGPFQ
ncbi:hypothetical protein A3197_18265 [Candidatus Thiodiazotropha endoloripes]|nr:hypothetical protein A3197_18265 [Candidatus Thiodiazotropha endoloripes]